MKRKFRKDEEEDAIVSSLNHGKRWQRGRLIGKGTFGSVFMATLKRPISKFSIFPPVMAVKSAEVSVSETLQKEKQAYDNIKRCGSLIKCFGEEITTNEHDLMIYNLLLEFAPGGTLADQIKNSGGKGLPENDVRRYTRSIIKGLIHIHKNHYIHCDLKPANILLVPTSTANSRCVAKIGDLGLAKRTNKTKQDPSLRGTLLYMAPETLLHNVQEPPSDVWALGCLVLEMLTGNHPWGRSTADTAFLSLVSENYEVPKIPDEVSPEAKLFLKRCFVRKPEFRFTAEMLMFLPFVAGVKRKKTLQPLQYMWRRQAPRRGQEFQSKLCKC